MFRFRYLPVIILGLLSLSMLTYEQGILLRVAEVVQRWNSQVTYEYVGDGWVEFTNMEGKTFRKQVGYTYEKIANEPIKRIVINVSEIDTNGFSDMFYKMATLPMGTTGQPCCGFKGRSGKNYLLGHSLLNGAFYPSKILEYSAISDSFLFVYEYDKRFNFIPITTGVFDIDNLPHILTDSGGIVTMYDTPVDYDFPVRRITAKDEFNSQSQEPRIYDFDADGFDELVMLGSGSSWGTMLTKFDTAAHVFVDQFVSNFNNNGIYGSWAVGDFDMDVKGEIATVTYHKYVIFVEYTCDTLEPYREIFTDRTRAPNGGLNHEGNDLDRDGRPEAFLGSTVFGGLMNIAVYEPIDDNVFEDSVWIEINDIGALRESLSTGDIDGDSTDELIVTYGGMLLILKSTANDEYVPYWLKFFPSEIGIRLFDFNDDGVDEIMVSQISQDSGFTDIFTINKATNIISPQSSPESISLARCYPNPTFNHATFSFTIPASGISTLTVYNAVGDFIATPYHGYSTPGMHSVSYNTSTLSPGIYFYSLSYKNHVITNKFVVAH